MMRSDLQPVLGLPEGVAELLREVQQKDATQAALRLVELLGGPERIEGRSKVLNRQGIGAVGQELGAIALVGDQERERRKGEAVFDQRATTRQHDLLEQRRHPPRRGPATPVSWPRPPGTPVCRAGSPD